MDSRESDPPPPPPPPQSSSLTQIGTLVVLGAIAANVFGFRYSRWAVGKDIHRAWERHQANVNASTSRASARARNHTNTQTRTRTRPQSTHSQSEQTRRKANHDARANADRTSRQQTHTSYQTWERVFRNGQQQTQSQSFRVDMDPEAFERLFREAQSHSNSRRNPFGMDERMLQQMLRAAAEAARTSQRGRTGRGAGDFDPFEFWERADGRTGAGSYAGQGEGVFGRRNSAKYYEDLGLKAGASEKEVKMAYRREVMKWHPDRYRGSDSELAARRFRQVTEAYNVLKK